MGNLDIPASLPRRRGGIVTNVAAGAACSPPAIKVNFIKSMDISRGRNQTKPIKFRQ